MIDFGFEALALHRITANIGPANVASTQLIRSLGMVGHELAHEMAYVAGHDDPTLRDYLTTLHDVTRRYEATA